MSIRQALPLKVLIFATPLVEVGLLKNLSHRITTELSDFAILELPYSGVLVQACYFNGFTHGGCNYTSAVEIIIPLWGALSSLQMRYDLSHSLRDAAAQELRVWRGWVLVSFKSNDCESWYRVGTPFAVDFGMPNMHEFNANQGTIEEMTDREG